jgi:hypothetical protein
MLAGPPGFFFQCMMSINGLNIRQFPEKIKIKNKENTSGVGALSSVMGVRLYQARLVLVSVSLTFFGRIFVHVASKSSFGVKMEPSLTVSQ